jgi:hypothetical protein
MTVWQKMRRTKCISHKTSEYYQKIIYKFTFILEHIIYRFFSHKYIELLTSYSIRRSIRIYLRTYANIQWSVSK